MGYLPLGLELVGRYLARREDLNLVEMLERLEAKKLAAQALVQTKQMAAQLGVAAAFQLTWEDEQFPDEAKRLCGLLSLFALAPIPWNLVEQCLPDWDKEDLEDCRVEQLLGRSLLSRVGQGLYQLHQLLREFFAAKLASEERQTLKTAVATTMIAVAQHIPQTPTLAQIQSVEAVIPHLKEVATDLLKLQTREELYLPDEGDLPWTFTGIGRFYESQGLYAEAEPWLETCLTVARSLLGEQHPDVATSLKNLAVLYANQGRLTAAEPLLVQALTMRQQLFNQHPDTVSTQQSLAVLRRMMSRST
ncbi:MAG: tetratricopeptide repeat protein [Microcoleaceae cyanobacterium]